MAPAVRVFRQFRASNTRVKAATLTGLAGLVLALAFLMGVVPALAGSGDPSGAGVQPSEIPYGGGSGACDADFPGLPSEAPHELWINNPTDGRFTGPDDTVVILDVSSDDMHFDFEFEDSTKAAYDVIVNGGSKNTHYDYDADGSTGPLSADTALHAPTKGSSSNLYSLSHINICYGDNPFADLSVTKTPVAVNGTPTGNGAFVADVGDTVEFDIAVTNSATSTVAATDVVVTDTLPTGMELAATGNDDWTTESDGTVTQTVASIPIGGTVTLDLFVTITEDGAGSDLVNAVSVSANENDPTANNDAADSVPPVTVTADVSGTKYHDRDTDGVQDATGEDGLAGWTISAFPVSVAEETGETTVDYGAGITTTTGADGSYSLNLVAGDYVICEAAPNQGDLVSGDPSELPEDGLGFTWSWGQSEPSGENADVCAGSNDHEPLGYAITVDGDITDLDFGNHRQVTINCSEANGASFEIPLGGDGLEDDPKSTVTFPAGCTTEDLTVTYDVGRSNPSTESGEPGEDDWTQFVVFGGDPVGTSILEQTIIWDVEEADYNADGTLLTLPSTLVQLVPGGDVKPAVLCNTLTNNEPNATTPHCLHKRVMDEGGNLPVETIQITEDYLFLGDPFSFR